jgi:hypothetical protein
MKTITHWYALAAAAVGTFLLTPAGKALLMQYPWLASVLAIATVAGIYHNPNKSSAGYIGGVMKVLAPLFLLLMLPGLVHAQTAALGQYQLGAGYSSVGGPTDNGSLFTVAKAFSPRVWGQAKDFMLSNPSGVNIATVGPRFRPPFSAIRKATPYLDTTKWFPFVDLDLGAVKDPTGHMTFAYGLGAGLDYQANSTVTLLILEADYIRSKFFPAGGILVTNVHTLTSGLKFTF